MLPNRVALALAAVLCVLPSAASSQETPCGGPCSGAGRAAKTYKGEPTTGIVIPNSLRNRARKRALADATARCRALGPSCSCRGDFRTTIRGRSVQPGSYVDFVEVEYAGTCRARRPVAVAELPKPQPAAPPPCTGKCKGIGVVGRDLPLTPEPPQDLVDEARTEAFKGASAQCTPACVCTGEIEISSEYRPATADTKGKWVVTATIDGNCR